MNGPNGTTIGWRFWLGPGLVSGLLLWGLYSMNAGLNSRMDRIDGRMDRMETRMDKIETELAAQGKALARIEGRLDPYGGGPGQADGG